jgi:hypothetical protein
MFSGLCPKPQYLFCLDTKNERKKVKAEEKIAKNEFFLLKSFNSSRFHRDSNRKDFLTLTTFIFLTHFFLGRSYTFLLHGFDLKYIYQSYYFQTPQRGEILVARGFNPGIRP